MGGAILAQGARHPPTRVRANGQGDFSVEQTKFPLTVNRGWPFSRGGVS